MNYDEIARYPNQSHWELKNVTQYYYPQELNVSATYITQVRLHDRIGLITHARVAKLQEKCPMQFPLIGENFARSFYHSKNVLIIQDIEEQLYLAFMFEHSRNVGFKQLNRAFDLKISPKNFREVIFIDFQNQSHHWRLKEGFDFNYVDMHSGRK